METFRWRREQAAAWLGLPAAGSAAIHLVPDRAAMTVRVPGAPEWAVAVTCPDGTMAFRLDLVDRSPSNSLDLVLKHETVHLVLNQARGRLPRWFEEGLCVHFAGVAYIEADTTLERFAAAGRLPTFAEADRLFGGDAGDAALGYLFGRRVVGGIVRRYGEQVIPRIVAAAAGGDAFAGAFARAAGEGIDRFEAAWRSEVTPSLPFWLFVILENFDLAVLAFGAALVALGYARWRWRRARAMEALGAAEEPPR